MILCILAIWTCFALALGFLFGKAIALADHEAEQQWNADLDACMERHPAGKAERFEEWA